MAGARSLAAFTARMEAKHGEQKIANEPPAVIVPTGSLTLDYALVVGGWHLGRLYEILGAKDSGKTTVGITSMAVCQAMFPDRGVAYVNMERTFSAERATALGLDCSEKARKAGRWAPLLPDSTEEASDLARDYVASGLYSMLVLDSVGALESKRVLDKDAEKAADSMGRNARIITQLTKALATQARENSCAVLLINQPRANMSGFGGDISAGPKAMQHSTTAKIEMRSVGGAADTRTMKFDGEDEPVGVTIRAKVSRLKNGAPGRVAQFYIMNRATEEYGPAGIDTGDEVAALGVRLGVIDQAAGGQYTLPDGTKIRGRKAIGPHLNAHPESLAAIRSAMKFNKPLTEIEAIASA